MLIVYITYIYNDLINLKQVSKSMIKNTARDENDQKLEWLKIEQLGLRRKQII